MAKMAEMEPAFIVLDQNRISDQPTVRRLLEQRKRTRQRIVLSPYARYEMTKGGWAGFLTDISRISKKPDAVFLAFPTLTVARWEVEQGKPVTGIYDMPSTENFRRVLGRFKAGELSPEREEPWFAAERESARRQLESVDWDAFFEKTAEQFVSPRVSSDEERGGVLRGLLAKDRAPFREAVLGSFRTLEKLADLLEGFRPVEGRGHIQAAFPSMIALNTLVGVSISYHRAVRGANKEWRKTGTVNFGIDGEGAVLACRGGDFETGDGLARSFFEDLRFFKSRIWPA